MCQNSPNDFCKFLKNYLCFCLRIYVVYMSCRKPQNVVCHKFCPHTKYLQACKKYFKNKLVF